MYGCRMYLFEKWKSPYHQIVSTRMDARSAQSRFLAYDSGGSFTKKKHYHRHKNKAKIWKWTILLQSALKHSLSISKESRLRKTDWFMKYQWVAHLRQSIWNIKIHRSPQRTAISCFSQHSEQGTQIWLLWCRNFLLLLSKRNRGLKEYIFNNNLQLQFA